MRVPRPCPAFQFSCMMRTRTRARVCACPLHPHCPTCHAQGGPCAQGDSSSSEIRGWAAGSLLKPKVQVKSKRLEPVHLERRSLRSVWEEGSTAAQP